MGVQRRDEHVVHGRSCRGPARTLCREQRADHASVFLGESGGGAFGSLEGVVVFSSSAVPVLPATVTPGIWAAVPVPNATTAIIICCTSRATWRLVTRTNRGRWCASRVGIGSRPLIAIVAATSVISSALACTFPWPIAEDPTARSSPTAEAAGIVLSAAPGIATG